ncbi:riboflavin kinase [Meira miltonrushii]|uniref:Riboflavin kinase n=1 Tax=Meira miltonrushii TaxID=1280837 RepID=A0A316V8P5_9BASI|nr:riboflavin kinase [Meira miltonrushii]PWN33398.1 riboflavin kinase [Meira miltonrushii]
MATGVPEIDSENSSKPSPAAFAQARANRPEVCGSYAPERPYPIYLRGVVERGFGRGGKDLGCPTANLPSKVMQAQPALQRTGIYFGFARILPQDPDDPDLEDASSMRRKKKRRVPIISRDARVYPMVMSVGWNPFYNNTTKTAEVHIIHKFSQDFYGLEMRVVVLGYIRPEYNYVSKDALIEDIEMDKKVAFNSLARSPYQDYVTDPFLLAPS